MQSVKLLPRSGKDDDGGGGGSGGGGGFAGHCAAVSFMDIKSAAKAHASENCLDDRNLVTDYYEPLLHESGRSSAAASVNTATSVAGPRSARYSQQQQQQHDDVVVVNSGGGGGYERPSSHFFERRGEHPDGGVVGSFLRRPVHYRDRPYRNGPFSSSQAIGDGGGRVGGGHFGRHSSSAGGGRSGGGSDAGGWAPYMESQPHGAVPGSRYAPPLPVQPDYLDDRPDRSDFACTVVNGGGSNSTPGSGGQAMSKRAAAISAAAMTTPTTTRKRKSRYLSTRFVIAVAKAMLTI